MEFKLVISDPKTGKSYNKAIKDADAAKFNGKIIGEEIDGGLLGLSGYKLKITGGSDKSGFPMKKGVHKSLDRVLMSEGVGYNPTSKVRKRKRVRGELITADTVQINTVVTTKGAKTLNEIFGIAETVEKKEEKKPEAAAEKKAEKTKEEKPAEKPKAEHHKEEKKQDVTEKKPEKPKAKE